MNEGSEKEVIELLFQMLEDSGWTKNEITNYIAARIDYE
jgi:hypothetical protein